MDKKRKESLSCGCLVDKAYAHDASDTAKTYERALVSHLFLA
jgi:hypothetical protein